MSRTSKAKATNQAKLASSVASYRDTQQERKVKTNLPKPRLSAEQKKKLVKNQEVSDNVLAVVDDLSNYNDLSTFDQSSDDKPTHLLGKNENWVSNDEFARRLDTALSGLNLTRDQFLSAAEGKSSTHRLIVKTKADRGVQIRIRPESELDKLIQQQASSDVSGWLIEVARTMFSSDRLGFTPQSLPRSKVPISERSDYAPLIPTPIADAMQSIADRYGVSKASLFIQAIEHYVANEAIAPPELEVTRR